jgi:cell volume regulation protein A
MRRNFPDNTEILKPVLFLIQVAMDVAIVVLFIGALIFFGNLFNKIFALTKIPDLLILIVIGIIIGPVFNLVTVGDFGIVGPLFATVTLAVILFEGGLHLKVATIKSAFRGTIALTLVSFIATMLIASWVVYYFNYLDPIPALMLGAAIGGTSSAVVIPMIEYLNLGKNSHAILALESAVTDVLCIVLVLTLLDVYTLHEFNIPFVALRLISSFLVAAVLGVICGIVWSIVYPMLKTIKSIFFTPAFLFIVYGVVTLMGFSGAIASLAFGITLGSLDTFRISKILPDAHVKQVELTQFEVVFLSQLVQVLKTFFFIFVGLSLVLNDTVALLLGLEITAMLFIVRILIVYFFIPKSIPVWDASVMSVMIPKGLAAAVLAAIPLQMGVKGGMFIETTTYAIILFSIMICSILVLLLDRTGLKGVYGMIFRKFAHQEEPGPAESPPVT